MARKPSVVKILAWRNPGPLGRAPRWDVELTRADGSRERHVGIAPSLVRRLEAVAEAIA